MELMQDPNFMRQQVENSILDEVRTLVDFSAEEKFASAVTGEGSTFRFSLTNVWRMAEDSPAPKMNCLA